MNIFPYGSKIPFMRVRRIVLVLTLIVFIGAVALLTTRGLNFALDFTGGTVVELKFERAVDLDLVRNELSAEGYQGVTVQAFGSASDVMVRLQPQEGQDNITQTGDAILTAVNSTGNPATLVRSDFVGAQVGKEMAVNGLLALVFVALGFIIYISMRFEWKFSVAATLASVFDVTATMGLFALTQHEFSLTAMAGVMSVLGYSINDTIVVFDRVRENFKALHKVDTIEVLNRSINETLSRTILTSLSTLFAVGTLYLFGGDSLRGLAEALLFGIVAGTFSSIFIACPLLTVLGTNKIDLLPKIRDDAELARRP